MKVLNKLASFSFILWIAIFLVHCTSTPELKRSTSKDTDSSLTVEAKEKIKLAKKEINLGNHLFQKEKIEDAKKKAISSIEIYPTPEGYYLLGTCEFKLGLYSKAKDAFEKALVISPKMEQVLLTYALTLTTLGEEEKAVETYRNLEEYFPKEKVYPFKQGVILKSLKRYAESYEALKRADDPSFKQKLQLFMQLGDVALQLKKYDEAEKYFAKSKEIDKDYKKASDSADATKIAKLLENGNRAVEKKEYEKAADFFREAAELSPNSSAPLIFLGNAYILLKRDKNAESTFQKALKIDPKNLDAYSSLGSIYSKMGKNAESIHILKRGLELFPSDASLYNKIGLSYKNLGDTKKALLAFSKSKELNPKFATARLNLGFLFLEEKRYLEAKREFAEALNLQGGEKAKEAILLTEVSLLIEKGDKLLSKGKIEEALGEFSKAKLKNHKEPRVFNAFGRVYFIAKKFPESENSFKASLLLDKNNIFALQGLIRIYSSQNKKEVRVFTERLESLSKGNPTAGIVIGRIHEDKKEFLKAEGVYKDLLSKFPDHESINYRLGNLYYKIALEKNSKEEFESAISYLEKAKTYKTGIVEIEETEKVIKDNLKFGEVLGLVKKGNKLFESRKYREALEFFTSAFNKVQRPSLLIKIAECHIALGEEEKGIRILKESIESGKDGKFEVKEAINAYFFKKGQIEKAEEGFKEILKNKPESHYSHYLLGLIYLGKKDYSESLKSLDRSISLNSDFAASHIARGLVYYKQNEKAKAKEEFEEAMKKDSSLEVAPYNIGILYFNDEMYNEAEKVFQEISVKYPEFPDSYYHLSFLHFKKNNLVDAEKYIQKALKIERAPAFLYAYIRILEAKYSVNRDQDIASLQSELNHELVEKFPGIEYARLAESRLIKASDESVIIQKYPLTDKPVSLPIYLNGKMIINYGYSLVLLDSRTKSVIWRKENRSPYLHVGASVRIFAVSKKSLDEIDFQTGNILKKISLDGKNPTSLRVKDKAYVSTVDKNGKSQITAYGIDGSKTAIDLDKNAVWELFPDGKLLLIQNKKSELDWSVYDSDLKYLQKGETVKESGALKIVSVRQEKIGVLRGKKFFDFTDHGKTLRYSNLGENIRSVFSEGNELFFVSDQKIIKIDKDGSSSEFQNTNLKEFSAMTVKNGRSISISNEGEVTLMKMTGEILKTKNIKDLKTKSGEVEIFSVLYRE